MLVSTFYIALIQGSKHCWLKNEPWCDGHFSQILEGKSSFQTTTFPHALNCVGPSLSWLQNRT